MDTMRPRIALLSCVICVISATAVSAPKRAIGDARDELEPPAQHAGGPDTTLVRALGYAFEPTPVEVRALAIEDLGFLGDSRALNALAQLCLDPNPALARAAIRAIGAIRNPRAEEILSNVVRHPGIPEATKLKALELLPFQNSWTALRFVSQVARSTPVTNVVLFARRMLTELPQGDAPTPARAPTIDLDSGTPTPAAPGSMGDTP